MTGLPIVVELINLVGSVITFLSQMTLLRWLTFLFGSQTVILIVPLFWISFFLLTLVFVLKWFSLHWEILIMLLYHFPLTFHQIHNGMARFIAQLMTILMLLGMVFVVISDMFHGRISLSSMLLLLLVNFVSRFRLELIYIPHRKHQVKPHSSPWFSAACSAAIVHRNHIFPLYQKDKSSACKVKFSQASNRCKWVLKLPNLHALIKQESITSQKFGSRDFRQIANTVLNKGKSVIPHLFNGLEVFPSASDKEKLFAENVSKNSNLDDLAVFPSRTNLKVHNISVTLKMFKKVIMNLDL